MNVFSNVTLSIWVIIIFYLISMKKEKLSNGMIRSSSIEGTNQNSIKAQSYFFNAFAINELHGQYN